MIEITIPGRGELSLKHLVLDVNGTLAVDGVLIEGVARRINTLRDRLEIHLLTANTHNRQDSIDKMLGLHAERILPGNEAAQKTEFVQRLGNESVISIGQGANDAGMLKASRLGIAVLSVEGLSVETLLAADLLAPSITDALDLLEKPLRLIATLRK